MPQPHLQITNVSVLELNRVLDDLRTYLDAERRRLDQLHERPAPVIPKATDTAKALGAGGAAPLNVANLTGRLAEVQSAAIPVVSALPDVSHAQADQVVFFGGHLYHFAAGNPGAWSLIL